ncbi:MAG TPA: hypothetical protein VK125_00255 [Bacillota bacterium]|nr:hypothetical protein [Bacillota bacterium]
MQTLTLKDIQKRVLKNTRKNEKATKKIIYNIRKKNLNKGRMRPKHPTEARILARFKNIEAK